MAERTYEINVRITVDDDVSADSLIDRMMYGLDGWAASYKEVVEPEPLGPPTREDLFTDG